ncbi:MAG: MFS transporter [Bdellovibrionales bacterium]|nr:MFS transporter [Bdellovibrionales bacterium]
MTRRQLCLFTLGQVGMMSLARYFFQWIIKYSTTSTADGTLFAAGAVGAVLLGFRLFDGVTDPFAGALSDYWVSKGKRRKQLLLFTLLLPGIGLALCFLPTEAMNAAGRWGLMVLGMFLFFVGYTFYAIPYWSLIDDYSRGDANLRRHLSNLLGAGLLIATGIGFVLSPVLVEQVGYFYGACIFAVLASIGMIGPVMADPQNEQDAPPIDHSADFAPASAFLQAFRQPRFLGLVLLLGGSQMSLTIMTSAAPFIAVDLLKGTEQDVSLLLGPLLGAALPCFLFAPRLSSRFGWEKVLVISSILLGVVYCTATLVGSSIIGSPFTTAMLIFVCGGPMVAFLLALEGEAITDCAKAAGGDSVSMFFGVYNLVVKAMNGIAIFIAGVFAEMSRGAYGDQAIRWMILAAGASLFVGMAAYVVIVRRRLQPHPS